MKKLFVLFVFGIFALGLSAPVLAQAQTTDNTTGENILETSAGALPDSPFYGLKRFGEGIQSFFTFDQIEKAKLKYKLAQLRLVEAETMSRLNKIQLAENALKDYEAGLNETEADKNSLSAAGRNISSIAGLVGNNTYKHILVLQKVYEKVPDSAKTAVMRVIEKSMEKHSKIAETLLQAEANKNNVNITIIVGSQTVTREVPAWFVERFLESANRLKSKVKEEVNMEDVEGLKEKIAEKIGIQRDKAKEQMNIAREWIAEVEQKLSNTAYANATSANKLFNEARTHMNNSEQFFIDGKYGDAYGQAVSAEGLARNILKYVEREKGSKERNRICVQVITYAISPSGSCRGYPTPCDVPEKWKKVDRCESSEKREGGAKCCMIAKGICKSDHIACIPENVVDCNSIICNPKVL